MYLTRFEVNPARRGARQLLGSPQSLHAAVLAGYPSGARRDGSRVLWRLDRTKNHAFLYVVGPAEPDLAHLVEQAGWPTTQGWTTRVYDGLLSRLEAGQQWAFRLKANPTHATRFGDNSRSQRLGHVTADQQLGWFVGRTATWGIDVNGVAAPNVIVHDRQTLSFRRDQNMVTLTVATFDGLLTVLDADALRNALVTGIGPAKAYGCGLMTLAPPA